MFDETSTLTFKNFFYFALHDMDRKKINKNMTSLIPHVLNPRGDFGIGHKCIIIVIRRLQGGAALGGSLPTHDG